MNDLFTLTPNEPREKILGQIKALVLMMIPILMMLNNIPQIRIPLMNYNRTQLKDQATKQRNFMNFLFVKN